MSRSATPRRCWRGSGASACGPGLAANPDTPFSAIEPFFDQVDLVLCMTVFPGFGGQEFMGEVMDKVIDARAAIEARELLVDLEVDGGIDERHRAAGRQGRRQRLRRRERGLRAPGAVGGRRDDQARRADSR